MASTTQHGVCALCLAHAPLQLSHVIPAFVFRWLRRTSATGQIRYGENPNKRVQDGLTLPLLCTRCETRLAQFEDVFARRAFRPWNQDPVGGVRYEAWLLKFCAAVCWRSLTYFFRSDALVVFDDAQNSLAREALQTWRDLLLGRRRQVSPFELHLLPIDGAVTTDQTSELPDNINRYLLRAVELDFAKGNGVTFVYVKMGRFLVFGFIAPPKTEEWRGTQVRTRGVLRPRRYELPVYVLEYLQDRAKRYRTLSTSHSERQQALIERDVGRDLARWNRSETKVAVESDVALFGIESFLRPPREQNKRHRR